MTRVPCGTSLRVFGLEMESTSGCLVRFKDQPDMVLLMGAAHGLVRTGAKQGDRIESLARPGEVLGTLLTWTTFNRSISADVALIWVHPDRVSAEILGLGAPSAKPNLAPKLGQGIQIFSSVPGDPALWSVITSLDSDVTLSPEGPGGWLLSDIVYTNHIVCEPMISYKGKSGAMVFDEVGRIVGMAIGGLDYVTHGDLASDQTYITPIGSILQHPDFAGRLEILSSMPSGAKPPPG